MLVVERSLSSFEAGSGIVLHIDSILPSQVHFLQKPQLECSFVVVAAGAVVVTMNFLQTYHPQWHPPSVSWLLQSSSPAVVLVVVVGWKKKIGWCWSVCFGIMMGGEQMLGLWLLMFGREVESLLSPVVAAELRLMMNCRWEQGGRG